MAIRIGTVSYEGNLFMAPMEGITDVPFRKMVRQHGCSVTCTQMIHANGLLRGEQHRMHEVTALAQEEKPVGIQLCGPEAPELTEASKKAQDMGFSFIDINMGCPAKNVVKNGSGSALLQSPQKAGEIIRSITSAVSIPVTVKIRAGWNEEYKSGLEVGKIIEEEGASLVTIHARTKSQRFKGRADWALIKELKSMLRIPVIGNGDIFDFRDIETMKQQTGADGFMVARGALGNPWIFSGARPTTANIRQTILSHLEEHMHFYPRKERALITFRKHVAWYTKGLPNSSEFRVRLFKEPDYQKFLNMFNAFFDTLDPNLIIIPCDNMPN